MSRYKVSARVRVRVRVCVCVSHSEPAAMNKYEV